MPGHKRSRHKRRLLCRCVNTKTQCSLWCLSDVPDIGDVVRSHVNGTRHGATSQRKLCGVCTATAKGLHNSAIIVTKNKIIAIVPDLTCGGSGRVCGTAWYHGAICGVL